MERSRNGRPLLNRAGALVMTLALVVAVAGPGAPAQARSVPARPVGPPSATVAVIGDSIVAGNRVIVQAAFASAGAPATVFDAVSGRAMIYRNRLGGGLVNSGLDAVQAVRQAGYRPSLWVVELGTNDRWGVQSCRCPDLVAFAGIRIDRVRAEIGFDQKILWMNVRNDSIGAAAINEALRRRIGPLFEVIDWDTVTRGRADWFKDKVHPNREGAVVLGELLASSVVLEVAAPRPDFCAGNVSTAAAATPTLSPDDDAAATLAATRCALG